MKRTSNKQYVAAVIFYLAKEENGKLKSAGDKVCYFGRVDLIWKGDSATYLEALNTGRTFPTGYKVIHADLFKSPLYYSSGKSEVIEDIDGDWNCKCGNNSGDSGFDPCDLNGRDKEPKKDYYYRCNGCGNIIDGDTLQVIRQVNMDEIIDEQKKTKE